MSYGFEVFAENRDAAHAAAEAKFDADTADQPDHAKDRAAVLANVGQALSLLPADKPVRLELSGWVSTVDGEVNGVSILYAPAETEPLPGVKDPRTALRSPDLAGLTLGLKKLPALEGATVYFDYGADGEANPITLTKSKVDAFRAIAYEGGSADVLFRVGSNDIDADEIGKLCSKLHSDIRVCVVPPPLPADDADEDNGAPLFEEPSDARKAAEAAFSDPGAEGMDPNADLDATQAFVDAHAAD